VEEYLGLLKSSRDYEFAETILENTTYVPFDELITELTRIINEFLDVIRQEPCYIYLNRRKFASTELMIIKIMHILDSTNLQGFVTDESIVPNGSQVAIIHDASYSGTNLEATIDSLTYYNKNLKIHIIIPYISLFMYDELPKRYNLQMYSSNTLLSIDEYRSTMNKEPFPDYLYDRFQAQDNLDIHGQLPLYFDHAVASKDSSFPTIYLEA
jgi:hypothetical protein